MRRSLLSVPICRKGVAPVYNMLGSAGLNTKSQFTIRLQLCGVRYNDTHNCKAGTQAG